MKALHKLTVRIMLAVIALILVGSAVKMLAKPAVEKDPSIPDYSTVEWPTKIPELPKPTARYNHLLALYLRNIDTICQKHQQEEAALYKQEKANESYRERYVEKAQATALGILRHIHSVQNTFIIDGDFTEGRLFVPGSSASARIWLELLRQGLLGRQQLLDWLYIVHSDELAPQWLPLLRGAVKSKKPNVWEKAVLTLLRAGIDEDVYRPVVSQWARKGEVYGDRGVYCLLFRNDATGRVQPQVSRENTEMMYEMFRESPSPLVRAWCAEYAADIGDIALAEDACLKILWIPYHERFSGESSIYSATDAKICHARIESIDTLFYGVRTASAFGQVFGRSVIAASEERNLPSRFAEYGTYPDAQFEIANAAALVEVLDHYDLDMIRRSDRRR